MFVESLEERRVLATFPAPVTSWEQAEFINNEVLFKTNGNLTMQQQAQLQAILNSYAAMVVSNWSDFGISHVRSANNWTRGETIAFAQALHGQSFIEYAEPNFVRHYTGIPNDTFFFPHQWGLHNIGQQSPYPLFFGGTVDADIDAVEAWDNHTGDSTAVVAIIDSGVDLQHPDLAANIWINTPELPDGFDNDGNGFIDDRFGWDTFDLDNDPSDVVGHGTHVAGISGAVGNNNLGVAGVSWNNQLMVVKAGDAGGLSTASIVGAQVYVTRMKTQRGINIVASNNSYGALGAAAFSFAEFDAIRKSTEAGIAFIAAAGNDGTNTDGPTVPHFPSGYNLPGIISVAATDRNDVLSTFSNRGFATVDLGAPGEEIFSTMPTYLPPLGPQPPAPNIPPIGYGWLDGTSMASPMVAGAYAVIKGASPHMSIAQVKNLMLTTVDVIPSLQFVSVSGGRLNLAKALDAIPKNEIHGTVWRDLDADGKFDGSENGLAGVTVYVDRNNNSILEFGEPSVVSQADGTYVLRGALGPGTFKVREVVPAGYRQTFPTIQTNFAHTVELQSAVDAVFGVRFGNQPLPGSIDGIKYLDIDIPGNTLGVRDANEPGLEGFVIYVDVNNDNMIGVGEPAAISGPDGRFRINNVLPGTYIVREVQRPGFIQTEPAGGAGVNVTVIGNQITFGVTFGNRAAIDWGDAPASYGTLQVNNGPRHGVLANFFLGDASDTSSTHIDDEINGVPSPDADADDLINTDDEDGVLFLTPVVPGQSATIRVDVSSGAFGSGFLQGWIDYNNDGDFFDAGEQILTDRSLTTGSHLISFNVPATAAVADTFARFRWSLQRGLGPTGAATAGEVEDYSTAARAISPTANDDGPFIVGRDSNFIDNEFDVLANDFPGVDGNPFFILSADATSEQGGLVQVDFINNVIRYQPPPDYIGPDSFDYVISDGINPPSLPGTVFIDVVPLDPVAIDDSFNINVGSPTIGLNVLANDIEGIGGPLTVVAIGQESAGGTAVYNATTKRIDYTPPSAVFQGADMFTYTISDGQNISQANVHVQVGGAASNQIVQIELRALNSLGEVLGTPGVAAPAVGDVITVAAFTRDLRGSFTDPIVNQDASGVLSTYADVIYNRDVVRPVPANNAFGIDIAFGQLYTSFQTATSSVPGIVDEAGAADTQFEYALGSDDNLLFTIRFNVRAEGILQFFANPFENTPDPLDFEFETNVHSNSAPFQPVTVPNSDVFFKHSTPVQIGANPEGEATNQFNNLDVNQDTIVSVNDAMLVVNHLNRYGTGPYTPMLAAASGQGVPQFFLDVSADGRVSPFDAKLVIDYLNWKASIGSSPEGEADDGLLVSQALGSTSGSGSSSSGSSSEDDDSAGQYAQNVDRLLASDLAGSAIQAVTSVADEAGESEDSEEHDEVLADW